jgi:rSAM/selenodomain-associated transferase 1
VDGQGIICVFAKSLRSEGVKTRLVPAVGKARARALAEAFLQDTWSVVSSLPWAKAVLAATDFSIASLLSGSPEVWRQGEGDLGARLQRVLKRALRSTSFVIAIGADSPGMPLRLFEHARSPLVEADAVIGPCADGGFYLLGLRRYPPGLLSGIPWSQPDTFARTVTKLSVIGLSFRILDEWFDVDRPGDLLRLVSLITAGEILVPQTQMVLRRYFRHEVMPLKTWSSAAAAKSLRVKTGSGDSGAA